MEEWNEKLAEFARVITNFNELGRLKEIPHPGWATLNKFCPNCGFAIFPSAYGLNELTF